jgi:hypothetical protein
MLQSVDCEIVKYVSMALVSFKTQDSVDTNAQQYRDKELKFGKCSRDISFFLFHYFKAESWTFGSDLPYLFLCAGATYDILPIILHDKPVVNAEADDSVVS